LDHEPKDLSEYGLGTDYLVTVRCDTWEKKKTMVMTWCEQTVRGRRVKRWKWNDRLKIDEWKVTHWASFPEPADD